MFRKLTFALLALTLLLAACAPALTPAPAPTLAATLIPATTAPILPPPTPDTNVSLTDGLGRQVMLAEPAQKVVSLAPSNTEILFAIGAGGQTVGRDMFSDYPPEALALTDIGGSMGEYNLEAILALQPDLVLAAEINPTELVKSLEDLGLTVFYLKNPLTLEEMYTNVEIVAQLTGRETEAAALVESLKQRVAAVDEKVAPFSTIFPVFYEIDASNPSQPYTAGKGTFITLLIARAGGYNIAAELDGYPQLSIEKIVADDPMFIILGDAMWGVTVESVGQRPGWENLRAVKQNKVFPFDDNLISRPGPRLVDGLEQLVELLRPGLLK
ncbi:MAG: ABC transporter substrate-binding protein [Anaerolineales bacterium]|jgi:iron complex transport system substrate-binding protein|nr:ABC transporter substrate-binding protein [Anaerolineales bacterium]